MCEPNSANKRMHVEFIYRHKYPKKRNSRSEYASQKSPKLKLSVTDSGRYMRFIDFSKN